MLNSRLSKSSQSTQKVVFKILVITLVLLFLILIFILNKKFSLLTSNLANQIDLLNQSKKDQVVDELEVSPTIFQNLVASGSKGDKGSSGSTGTKGDTGSTGGKGDTGDSGSTITSITKTTTTHTGLFTSNGKVGYQAANDICNSNFSGSHFCRTDEIIQLIAEQDISDFTGDAWIAEGPPGYTSKSNDCKGWTTNGTDQLGAYWYYDSSGGGKGWLVSCGTQLPLSCCQ